MKGIKKFFYVVFISILVVMIISLFVLCVLTFDCKNVKGSLELVAVAFTGITSTLGVIISTMNLKETRERFRNSKIIEVRGRWYKELVLDRHLNSIKIFFDSLTTKVDSLDFCGQRETLVGSKYDKWLNEEIFEYFTTEYTTLHRDLTTDLGIISDRFSLEVSKSFSDFQDDFTVLFDQNQVDKEKVGSCIKKYYEIVVSSLINFDETVHK